MEKNDMMNEANEALKRTLLMMNYDMKKTLTENVEVVSEQGTKMTDQEKEDYRVGNLISHAAYGAGTDEDAIVDAFSQIKDAEQFQRIENNYERYAQQEGGDVYKSLSDLLNDEFESEDDVYLKKIKDALSKIGVNLTYDTEDNSRVAGQKLIQFKPGTIKLSVGSTGNSSKSSATSSVSSLDDLKKLINGKNSNVNNIPSWKVEYPNSIIQFANNGRLYQFTSDGKNLTKKGNWKIENGKVVKTYDGSTKKEVVKKTLVPAVTDKALTDSLNFNVTFPGDKQYVYAFLPDKNVTEQTTSGIGTWFAKNTKTGKIFNISKYYPQTEKKLDTMYPEAKNLVDKSPKDLNTTTTPPPTGVEDIQGKKLEVQPVGEPDMSPKDISVPQNTQTPPKKKGILSKIFKEEDIKNSLKKGLNEIKENKENLMIESNIVEKRFNFIVEGKTFDTEQDQNYLIESIISEIGYLKTQGYNSQAINEGLFSMLGGLLGGAFKSTPQVFGEYVAGWLMKTLGVPENSYIASSIQALVGNLNISDYDRMFSDCRFASNKIADSLIEGYVLQLQKQKDLSSGAGGFIISAMRNSVVDYFTEDKNSLIQKLEDTIGEFLCPKLSKLSGTITDKADDLKAKMAS